MPLMIASPLPISDEQRAALEVMACSSSLLYRKVFSPGRCCLQPMVWQLRRSLAGVGPRRSRFERGGDVSPSRVWRVLAGSRLDEAVGRGCRKGRWLRWCESP